MVKRLLVKFLIFLTCLLNFLTLGGWKQCFSSRQYHLKRNNKPNLVWLIDKIFFIDPDHCMHSWIYYKTGKNYRKYKWDPKTKEYYWEKDEGLF